MDGPLGGHRIDLHLLDHASATAVWYHPGSHPAFAGHIRYGLIGDGRWYVQWTGGRDYAFAERDDAEVAITDILHGRDDGLWVRKL